MYLQNKGTSLWNFVEKSGLRKILPQHIDRHRCCQVSLVDDHLQVITLSIGYCIQHDGLDAVCHAGSSVTVEICFVYTILLYDPISCRRKILLMHLY